MILLDATGLVATRPERPLFSDVTVTLSSGDRLAVVGLNGCGKSTLLRQLAGTLPLEAGTVRKGRGTRVVVLDQAAELPAGTVAQAVGDGWDSAAILDKLGMAGLTDRTVDTLSGGQAKRVALARALVAVGPPGGDDDDAVLLILDEPTNHLDIDAIAWLEDRLATHRGGLILVTHDRHVLDRVTTRILELDRGKGYVHEGGYAGYLEARALRADQEASTETKRRNLARTELAWLRRGAPARTRKPKARIASATATVQGRAPAAARGSEDLPLHFGTPRLGDRVVELHGVGHRFDGSGADPGPWLFRGVDLALAPDERLGIVGPNGAGKSTLLNVLSGRIVPAEGSVDAGSTTKIGVFDQRGLDLDPSIRVREAVAGPRRQPDWEDARLLEAFWFDSDAQWAPIGLLSGGERRRLQLLLTLRERPNVLLLDEPTNDLDLDTLRVLEDFLDDFPGAVVVVSHDRALLERTVTDVIVIDEKHSAQRVPGGYAAWEEARRAARRGGGGGSGARAGSAQPSGASKPGRREAKTGSAQGQPSGKPPPAHLRKLLKEAEREVRTLDRRRAQLGDDVLAAGTDHTRLAELGRELAEVAEKLAAAEDTWLELATLQDD